MSKSIIPLSGADLVNKALGYRATTPWLTAWAPGRYRDPAPEASPTRLLEVQTLEVIPEDLHLVGHPFPVGNVEGPNSSTAT